MLVEMVLGRCSPHKPHQHGLMSQQQRLDCVDRHKYTLVVFLAFYLHLQCVHSV